MSMQKRKKKEIDNYEIVQITLEGESKKKGRSIDALLSIILDLYKQTPIFIPLKNERKTKNADKTKKKSTNNVTPNEKKNYIPAVNRHMNRAGLNIIIFTFFFFFSFYTTAV